TVDKIRRRLENVDVGALTMGAQSLIELLVGQRLNPFPLARLTERPDVVAAHLAEGHVVVFVDTSPTAIILPANVWHFTQHAEEHFQAPAVGTFMRWVRFLASGLSLLVGQGLNPFPLARLTERPDVVAAHLAEGHVVVFVDTSPTAIILPANVWHFTQHAEEYFQAPAVGTFMRWVRFLAIGLSLVLGPAWLAVATWETAPDWISFIGPAEKPRVALWLQFLLLEFGLVLIGQALIHTPTAMSTALGIVGAILLGELAITVRVFVPETVLYVAVAALMSFATPSIEFAHALRLFRYGLFVLVALWGWWGFGAGLAGTFLWLALTNSFGLPYLYPLLPFNGK